MDRPIKATEWIEENAHAFQPPVANKLMYKNELSVMFVGGPNSRTDFHIDESSEFFFQMKGSMNLVTIQGGKRKLVPIKAGEVYLLPSRIPHSPQRPEAGSVGLVIERQRDNTEYDCMRWYKDFHTCEEVEFEQFFYCSDLAKDLVPVANAYKEFVSSGNKFERRPDLPVTEDTDIAVPAPFSLSEWCQEHAAELERGRTLNLFGSEHPDKEFKILVSSETGYEIRSSQHEIFIYQIRGDATITMSDSGKSERLETSACFVVPAETYYHVTARSSDSIVLILYCDPLGNKISISWERKIQKFQFAPSGSNIQESDSSSTLPHRYHRFAWDCEYVTPQRDSSDRVNKFYRGRFGLLDDIDDLNLDMDEEMWFSLSPKEVSKSHAAAFQAVAPYGLVIDMFAGLGCDLLQVPTSWFGIGCDIVQDRLLTAKSIHKRIGRCPTDYVAADSMGPRSCFRRAAFDVVYLSPPWGHHKIVNRKQTPVYGRRKLASLAVDGFRAFISGMKLAKDMNIAYYLPRGMDVSELRLLAETAGDADIIFVDIHESFDPDDETVSEKHKYRVRAITVYFGNLARNKIR